MMILPLPSSADEKKPFDYLAALTTGDCAPLLSGPNPDPRQTIISVNRTVARQQPGEVENTHAL